MVTAVVGMGCGSDTADVASDRSVVSDPVVDESVDVAEETHTEMEDTHSDEGDTQGTDADLVIPVAMVEFGYDFEAVDVPVGSTVRFDFVNEGAIEHEVMIGDHHQQEEFAADPSHSDHDGEMTEGHHGDVYALTLQPGESGSLVVTFEEPGEILLGCHLPGHFDAGMVAPLEVI
jgi:uncharacterized cupredoxin-like copper-binding protein